MKKTALILMMIITLMLSYRMCTAEDLTSGDFSYVILDDGTAEITKYQGEIPEVIIPDEIDSIPVTSIGSSAFGWNADIISVAIPNSVTAIGDHAFAECTSLETAAIPENLVWLGDGVFQGCVKLKEAVLPTGLIRIGWNPFDRCSLIKEIVLPSENPFYTVRDGVLFDRKSSKLVTYPAGAENSTYEVPDWITGIGMAAFSENPNIKEIAISDGMTELEGNPFCGCTSLEELKISSQNPVYEFSHNVLFNRQTNTLIAYLWGREDSSYGVPAGTIAISQEAFYKHPELKRVDLPASVRILGNASFAESGLTSMQLPDSIVSLGNNTFNRCADLVSVKLPSGLKYIGDSVFYECIRLRSVSLPKTLRSIGNAAFYLCRSMRQIVIPEGTQTIGNYAFAGCFSLQAITVPESVSEMGHDVFYSDENVIMTAPHGSYAEKWAEENGVKLSEPKRLPTELI